MGHSEPASGLCSIAKVVVAMERGCIPANLHYKEPNPDIPALSDGRIKVIVYDRFRARDRYNEKKDSEPSVRRSSTATRRSRAGSWP